MLGDLIWDYFDQKGIIKKSADQWAFVLRYF